MRRTSLLLWATTFSALGGWPSFCPLPKTRVTTARMATKEMPPSGPSLGDLKGLAGKSAPLGPVELDKVERSLRAVAGEHEGSLDWSSLRSLLAARAHLPHKDWASTEESAASLREILGGPDDEAFRSIFERVLLDGGWDNALRATKSMESHPAGAKPWVVLVTGVNGIRKTTSVYQPWFKSVLEKALGPSYSGATAALPGGSDSFFRQLDYMIATVASEDFRTLYAEEDLATYSAHKDGIFTRYRTLAEMLGVLLLREAQQRGMNVMVETSGRDIAMFRYVDHLFPDGGAYNKLVVHFTIDDLSFAERSVDARMAREMRVGSAARDADTRAVIAANAGGPYGSEVLRGVRDDSDRVWSAVLQGNDAGASWYKASIAITPRESDPWSACAVGADGNRGEDFEFLPLS
mmetsp:Transcript_56782/g.122744  ORF Transcript_56782/g.122744 Transcript_56782/m.122744 type:complete len:407 (+) Transcript_56782:86-1306(+)